MRMTGNIVRQKDAKKVVYMAMDQKVREVVQKLDSCRDGRELSRIAEERVEEKNDVVEVS